MITYKALERFARTVEGQVLRTQARGSEFHVHVLPNGLQYVPESNKPRKQTQEQVENILEQYNKTRSMRPSDYTGTMNASYALALIAYMSGSTDRAS